MDFLTSKEVNGLKGDIKLKEDCLEMEKDLFAQQMLNGLGEQIRQEMHAKPDKKFLRKYKWQKLKENLKNIL